MTYNATLGEHELALALDLPLYCPDPRHAHIATKSGSRELFARTGIPHPLGVEHIRSRADAVHAIARLQAIKPGLAELVVKLEDGVLGEANAIIDLLGLLAPGAADELSRIGTRLAELVPAVGSISAATFLDKLARHAGIVEERIAGRELRSPSVQFHIAPGGALELLSTHDQILDGPSGQRYPGCRFPADPSYASKIGVLAGRAAQHVADIGVIGASRSTSSWSAPTRNCGSHSRSSSICAPAGPPTPIKRWRSSLADGMTRQPQALSPPAIPCEGAVSQTATRTSVPVLKRRSALRWPERRGEGGGDRLGLGRRHGPQTWVLDPMVRITAGV